MANPLLNAKVKATGKSVQVYAHHLGGYVDYSDCSTKYKESELKLEKG